MLVEYAQKAPPLYDRLPGLTDRRRSPNQKSFKKPEVDAINTRFYSSAATRIIERARQSASPGSTGILACSPCDEGLLQNSRQGCLRSQDPHLDHRL